MEVINVNNHCNCSINLCLCESVINQVKICLVWSWKNANLDKETDQRPCFKVIYKIFNLPAPDSRFKSIWHNVDPLLSSNNNHKPFAELFIYRDRCLYWIIIWKLIVKWLIASLTCTLLLLFSKKAYARICLLIRS